MHLDEALRRVMSGETLERDAAHAVFAGALSGGGADPAQLAGFLVALAQRGETADEIAGAADAVRAQMLPLDVETRDEVGGGGPIDTCGTGGDGLGTFNLSTAAAVVACAAGARVLKHGNRALSSRSGSADLLEAAGIPLDLAPAAVARVFDEVGITFLFAPTFHPSMRFAAPVRRALGIRTVFNYLGPLCNPGRVRRQLLGTSDPERVGDFARVLEVLGHHRAYVVHGAGGADELTLAGKNRVRSVGDAPAARFDAEALGLEQAPVAALAGGDKGANLALLADVLDGARTPVRDAVLLNAAAALVVAGTAATAEEGVAQAREAIDSGKAKAKLAAWARTARRLRDDGGAA